MIITGIMSIIYNGSNYLNIKNQFTHHKIGKSQWQRLYNIIIMYPIFLYVYLYYPLPKYLEVILLWDIILGTLYNSYNFTRYF